MVKNNNAPPESLKLRFHMLSSQHIIFSEKLMKFHESFHLSWLKQYPGL